MMIGPPSAGKTRNARALPSILPTMTNDEALDVTRTSRAWRICCPLMCRSCAPSYSAPRITPSAMPVWWAGATGRTRGRST